MFVIADGENMEERIVYDQMRSEERWRDLLDKTRSVQSLLWQCNGWTKIYFLRHSWMHFGTVNLNHGWMSTVDEKTGYGNIEKEDFVKLLESHGFRAEWSTLIGRDRRDHVL